MNNPFLKADIAPYQSKGRWYQFFVETDVVEGDAAYVLTTSDVEDAEISGSYLKLPKGYRIIDQKFDLTMDAAAADTFTKGIHYYADGAQGIVLPDVDDLDYCYIWIFADYEA